MFQKIPKEEDASFTITVFLVEVEFCCYLPLRLHLWERVSGVNTIRKTPNIELEF
jgi:hypothetical protein